VQPQAAALELPSAIVSPARRRLRRPHLRLTTWAVLAGLVVGIAAAAGLVASGRLDDRATAAAPKAATAEFLAAFERSLRGTYVVDGTYTRTLDCSTDQANCVPGQTMTSGALVVQRPPDHLRRELGNTEGAIGGHVITCDLQADGTQHCGPTARSESFEQSVASQMTTLRSYFTGTIPLYAVVHDGDHCFALTQVREYASAPYGSSARMCFDPTTGAMTYVKRWLEGATDVFQAQQVRAQVSDADFNLAADPSFDPHFDK
jgi:hypothetical protein